MELLVLQPPLSGSVPQCRTQCLPGFYPSLGLCLRELRIICLPAFVGVYAT